MFLGPLLGMPLPFLPLQILWMNLVTDGFPALALGVEPAESSISGGPVGSNSGSLSGAISGGESGSNSGSSVVGSSSGGFIGTSSGSVELRPADLCSKQVLGATRALEPTNAAFKFFNSPVFEVWVIKPHLQQIADQKDSANLFALTDTKGGMQLACLLARKQRATARESQACKFVNQKSWQQGRKRMVHRKHQMGNTKSEGLQTWEQIEGQSFPLGAVCVENGCAINFAIYSKHATDITLLLFDEDDYLNPSLRIRLLAQ